MFYDLGLGLYVHNESSVIAIYSIVPLTLEQYMEKTLFEP